MSPKSISSALAIVPDAAEFGETLKDGVPEVAPPAKPEVEDVVIPSISPASAPIQADPFHAFLILSAPGIVKYCSFNFIC